MKYIVLALDPDKGSGEVFGSLEQFLMDNPDIVEEALCSNIFYTREIINSIYLNSLHWSMLQQILEEIDNEVIVGNRF